MKLYFKDNKGDFKVYGSTTEDFERLNKANKKIEKDLIHKKENPQMFEYLKKWLDELGIRVKFPNRANDLIKVNSIIEALNKFQIILPDKNYITIGINKLGYIIEGNSYVIEDKQLPIDLFDGYYKLDNGKPKLDKDMKIHLYLTR
jgi:hypothetical protein